ncbi:MAG: hypothetical protein SynsKO_34800 [Synoicihabitans sp.]
MAQVSFFKKLLGGKPAKASTDSSIELPADSPAFQGDLIKAHDKFGREILITRKDWFESVLKGNLEKAWDQPDELVNLINSAFNDEFTAALDSPTRRLLEIDPDPVRGSVYRAVYLLETSQPAEAETVLQDHIRAHGESGLVLVNLAKAQHAQRRIEESEQTLWRGIELDPNQENGLVWIMALHREKGGADAEKAVLEKIAALPGSWRAPLWQARAALEAKDLESAQSFYAQALERTTHPVPFEVLQQMSGDLGNFGHLPELLTLTLPHFDVSIHGMAVGNNLIKASIDTGQLDQARQLMRLHQQQQRPDWAESLAYWENALSEAQFGTEKAETLDQLKVSMLEIAGPLWLKEDQPTAAFFPGPTAEAPTVCFLGSTFEKAAHEDQEVVMGLSDNPGRFSRGIPLLLCEVFHQAGLAGGSALIPWAQSGGFVVSTVESSDETALAYAEKSGDGKKPDYAIYSHLITRGENWTLKVRLLRRIDGKRLHESTYDFAEGRFHPVGPQMIADMMAAFTDHAEQTNQQAPDLLVEEEFDAYLFRLEQCLAATCAAMDGVKPEFLHNPSDIMNGMLGLCLQNPNHAPSRMLLLRTARAFKKAEPALLTSFQSKLEALMADHSLAEPLHTALQKELNEGMVA